jgi:hypothetical protein
LTHTTLQSLLTDLLAVIVRAGVVDALISRADPIPLDVFEERAVHHLEWCGAASGKSWVSEGEEGCTEGGAEEVA